MEHESEATGYRMVTEAPDTCMVRTTCPVHPEIVVDGWAHAGEILCGRCANEGRRTAMHVTRFTTVSSN